MGASIYPKWWMWEELCRVLSLLVLCASTRHALPVGPQLWGGQVVRVPGRDWSCNICVLSPAGYQLLRAVQAWQPARSSPVPVSMPLLEHVHFRSVAHRIRLENGLGMTGDSQGRRSPAEGRDQRGSFMLSKQLYLAEFSS